MSKCACDFCKEYKSNKALMERTISLAGTTEEDFDLLRALVMKNWERALEAEEDNEYYQLVRSGKWPSSKQQELQEVV